MTKFQSIKALCGIVIVIIVTAWATLQIQDFFSSSSEAGPVSHNTGPAFYISTSELQRRLNSQYPQANLVVDGRCGPATQRWWDRAYGDQNAMKLWPE